MNEASSLINCDINQALSKFNECFEHAVECMNEKQYLLGMKKEKSGLTLNAGKVEKFSDNTCVSFVNLTDKDRLSYSQKRREYKELLRHKKQSHKSNILQSLQTHIKDPKKFLVRNKPGGYSAVSTEE